VCFDCERQAHFPRGHFDDGHTVVERQRQHSIVVRKRHSARPALQRHRECDVARDRVLHFEDKSRPQLAMCFPVGEKALWPSNVVGSMLIIGSSLPELRSKVCKPPEFFNIKNDWIAMSNRVGLHAVKKNRIFAIQLGRLRRQFEQRSAGFQIPFPQIEIVAPTEEEAAVV